MRIIHHGHDDPHFNLAAEEYLLEQTDGDIFMLWRNAPAVIIGRNQNAWAEVNTDFTEAHGIPVVRRLTGGGAVFHDPGNVNFTFITDADEDTGIDFARFTAPVVAALRGLGIEAAPDGRNDIIAGGYKISGNAQCRHRRRDGGLRLMHHGTLLYDADLGNLAGSLRVNSEKLRSKGIRSVSSRVRNLRDIGGLTMDAAGFADYLREYAEREYGCAASGLTGEEVCGIAALAEAKYSAWEWNFGRSPEYGERRCARFPWGSAEVGFTVVKGIITDCSVSGDFFGAEDTAVLTDALTGIPYRRDAVADALAAVPVGKVIHGAETADVLTLLFGDG